MGVPGFYSWLTKRYPLIKYLLGKEQLPGIDYLYLDMNGIIYKCVKDDSIIFKTQVLPKEFQDIWIQIFNYINMIVNLLKPRKMIFMALDGVAPRSKMNNQRSRRFRSAKDHKQHMENFLGYTSDTPDSQENFKNNSISPGTKFMEDLNEQIRFFIAKKIQQDQYWRHLSIIFSGSDAPGEGEHKIMQFARSNNHQFEYDDNHCFYGADADLIMLALTLPMKNICIIREQYIFSKGDVKIVASRSEKKIQFQIIFITILREYLNNQFSEAFQNVQNSIYDSQKAIKDFVFLFFFIGNDFLPRCMAYNIRKTSIQKLIQGFKRYLASTQDYIVGKEKINMKALSVLTACIAAYQKLFIDEKQEDVQQYLEKKKFNEEFQQQMKYKLDKEADFLLNMRQAYANQDGSSQQIFYNNKFNIDPFQQTDAFMHLLGSYLYGLNFVYQYYFKNLPSWSWYYPYYYAPLLTDLARYVDGIAQRNIEMQQFEKGQPFQPFKQLLCILPKQSADLLPEQIKQLITNEQSALRSPFDYYTDDFGVDMYGSLYEYEAISIIPFLNLQIVDKLYSEALKNVSPEDLTRNQFRKNQLYEYNYKIEEKQFPSSFPHIRSVKCRIQVTEVDLLNQFKWSYQQTNLNEKEKRQKHLRMPSLLAKNVQFIKNRDKKGRIYYQVIVHQQQQKKFKLGSPVFYGFPLQYSGRIQAIISKDKLKFLQQFNPQNYQSLNNVFHQLDSMIAMKNNPGKYFDSILKNSVSKKYLNVRSQNCQKIAFIQGTNYFVRNVQGKFKRCYEEVQMITDFEVSPFSLISEKKLYETTRDQIYFKDLQDEFHLDQQVLILRDEQYLGSLGIVKGYNIQENKVKVLINKPRKFKANEYVKQIGTDQIFFTLSITAAFLQTKPDILTTILGSVPVILAQKKLPQSIDIGLNFICRKENKLVPNLVRINYAQKQDMDQKEAIKNLEISMRGVELLVQYKKKFPKVFQFINKRHHQLIAQSKQKGQRIDWQKQIMVGNIFKNEDAAVRSLMQVYLWLIKHQQIHMPMSSLRSKQVFKKRIQSLKNQFLQKHNQEKKEIFIEKQFDPNFLYSRRLAEYGLMYLNEAPKDNFLADFVICLKPQFFGHAGVVIGIDNDKYEVLFEHPSFGKTGLGGICSNLWGGKFKYRQLFNLSSWPQQLKPRTNSSKNTKKDGWTSTRKQYFPKFKSKPLDSFEDIRKLEDYLSKQFNIFFKEFMQRTKPVDLTPQFHIVDNRSQQYKYKYDRHETTIPQQQIQKFKKTTKYVEKTIQTPEPEKKKFVEKIQQKVTNTPKKYVEKKVEDNPKQQQIQNEKQQQIQKDGQKKAEEVKQQENENSQSKLADKEEKKNEVQSNNQQVPENKQVNRQEQEQEQLQEERKLAEEEEDAQDIMG